MTQLKPAYVQNTPTARTFLLLCSLAVALLYMDSYGLKLFADDFASWNTVNQLAGPASVFSTTYNPEFYRPLELLLIRLNIHWWGFNPVFYHVVALAGHILTSLALFVLARRLRFSMAVGIAASLVFGLSNVNAMSVLGNDTASQIFSSLFGMLALIAVLPNRDVRIGDCLLAAGLLILSLHWKETGASYCLAVAVALVAGLAPQKKIKRLVVLMLPILAVVIVYGAMRQAAGITGPDLGSQGRYQFWIGLNIPRNLALMFAAMITPVGTTILLLHQSNTLFVALCIAVNVSLTGSLIFGLWSHARRSPDRWRPFVFPTILMFVLFVPDIFLTHISELYAYKPNALFCVLFAVAIVEVFHGVAARGKALRIIAVGFFVFLLMCHVVSVKHKQRLMQTNGDHAQRMLLKIKKDVPVVPAGTPILISNFDPGPGVIYSVFFIHGVWVLGAGGFYEYLYGNELAGYRYLPPKQLAMQLENLEKTTLVITYDRGKVHARLANPAPKTPSIP